jgi:plasmid stability protein
MERIALVGAGLIGQAWAIVFGRAGHEVTLYDPEPGALSQARGAIAARLGDLAGFGLAGDPQAVLGRIAYATGLAEALDGAAMVQIRNVPDALHRKLKSRAADSGQTLSDFLLAELARLAARPTRDEMLTRIHSRTRVTLKTPAAVVIREERESA